MLNVKPIMNSQPADVLPDISGNKILLLLLKMINAPPIIDIRPWEM